MINFDFLINKTITGIDVSDREEYLRLHFQGGEDTILLTDGDCCSETWFAEILSLDALLGEKILSGENLEIPHKEDGNNRQEWDSFYGFALRTAKGTCTIVFRNSSNGYYGGGVCTMDNLPGWSLESTLKHLTKQTWRPIVGAEWTAYGKKETE